MVNLNRQFRHILIASLKPNALGYVLMKKIHIHAHWVNCYVFSANRAKKNKH